MAQYLETLEFQRGDLSPANAPANAAPTTETPIVEPEKDEASEPSWLDAEVEVSVATYQAYQILYYAFTALMAVAGLDKFVRLLSTWDQYVSPAMASFLHLSSGALTILAGIMEVLAAAAVALKPRIGSWVVTVWLWLIVVNLLTMSGHFDMMLSTLALSAAGFAFTRLSAECN